MTALRGHHLLCMLGFRGMGYSDEYALEMAKVQDRLRSRPETQVTLVAGPDDLCKHYPPSQPCHCDDENIHRRDATVVERLGLQVGECYSWHYVERCIATVFVPEDIPSLCSTCPWLPHGVCESGVERVRMGEGLMDLGMRTPSNESIIEQACQFVRERLNSDSSGHDWWHAYRVWQLTKVLAGKEGGHVLVCELAALLHDLVDDKVGHLGTSATDVEAWLNRVVPKSISVHVMDIIETMSYRAGHNPPMKTLEGKIVQDADRLDALGAVGIARTFAYSGAKGQLIHDPNLLPRENMTLDAYRHGPGTAINHFYEKLLKLKALMNTESARSMAIHRHEVLEVFLSEFQSEWDGSR